MASANWPLVRLLGNAAHAALAATGYRGNRQTSAINCKMQCQRFMRIPFSFSNYFLMKIVCALRYLVCSVLGLNLGVPISAVKQKEAEQHLPRRQPARRAQHFVTTGAFFTLGNVAQQIAVHASAQSDLIVANSIRPSFGKTTSVLGEQRSVWDLASCAFKRAHCVELNCAEFDQSGKLRGF